MFKKQVHTKILLACASAFFISSCGNKTRLKGDLNVQALEASAIGFQQVFDEVLEKNCLECHVTYSNYQVVAKQADKIMSSILSGRMPKKRPALDKELKSIVKIWVDQGSPKVPGVETKDLPLGPTFESLVANVFAPKCLACHSGNPEGSGPVAVNFSTYKNLLKTSAFYIEKNRGVFVDPSSPKTSRLVESIEDFVDVMPPYSVSDDPDYVRPPDVTPEELKVILEWISQGFPEK